MKYYEEIARQEENSYDIWNNAEKSKLNRAVTTRFSYGVFTKSVIRNFSSSFAVRPAPHEDV